MNSENTIILGIESSCDDTGAAIMKNGKLLANVIAGQQVHSRYGGVVPELASRAHQRNIVPTVAIALEEAEVKAEDICAVAYTYGPGLMGSLLVGASFAKALAMSLNIPSIAVDHMRGHILSHFIHHEESLKTANSPRFPFLALTVSGGHTELVIVHDHVNMEVIGKTIDDAVGEAFDKTAKMIGLTYPGGPMIDRLSRKGKAIFEFNKPKVKGLDMSFSGLKTSILYFLRDRKAENPKFIEDNINDICASVQTCITEILMQKLKKAIKVHRPMDIALAGGVAANSQIRRAFQSLAENEGLGCYIPDFQYCTDNAAMIAMVGHFDFLNGVRSSLDLTPRSNLAL
ncbi:MAG: tRNA (adenosine(37)-N6)-threonylcarbamoyltransferase complex transferase subunit TsaD [Flavobacteriales bacterium]|nr:tRNA (adenosine(37)-N6)-threonylcarbamoyltransferase complex transferase subunit TsaD [Flavobacteriales bacterium]